MSPLSSARRSLLEFGQLSPLASFHLALHRYQRPGNHRQQMSAQSKEQLLPPWGLAVAGSAGACVANALVYPLDIVKTRLQVQTKRRPGAVGDESAAAPDHYDSTIHAITKIVEDEGILGLYTGIVGSLIGVSSTNFAYFYWYSVVRTLYLKSQKIPKAPGTAIELSLGAVAGALAQLFTIPIAVVTTRQQTQTKLEKKGMLETAREVIDSEDGYSGLWRGLKASLVLVVNPAITYGAYQRLKDVFFPNKTHLKAWEAFLLGAASKALATIATQPLIVAKVRLQSKPPADRKGKRFSSFVEVLQYTIEHEGVLSLYKGIGPQLAKGLLVQGLLMMSKERIELLFVLLFAYVRRIRQEQLKKLADLAAAKAKEAGAQEYVDSAVDQVQKVAPAAQKYVDSAVEQVSNVAPAAQKYVDSAIKQVKKVAPVTTK